MVSKATAFQKEACISNYESKVLEILYNDNLVYSDSNSDSGIIERGSNEVSHRCSDSSDLHLHIFIYRLIYLFLAKQFE